MDGRYGIPDKLINILMINQEFFYIILLFRNKERMIYLFFNYKTDYRHLVFPNEQINNANSYNSFMYECTIKVNEYIQQLCPNTYYRMKTH